MTDSAETVTNSPNHFFGVASGANRQRSAQVRKFATETPRIDLDQTIWDRRREEVGAGAQRKELEGLLDTRTVPAESAFNFVQKWRYLYFAVPKAGGRC